MSFHLLWSLISFFTSIPTWLIQVGRYNIYIYCLILQLNLCFFLFDITFNKQMRIQDVYTAFDYSHLQCLSVFGQLVISLMVTSAPITRDITSPVVHSVWLSSFLMSRSCFCFFSSDLWLRYVVDIL